ncbi:MAG: hypothetical protein AAB922_00670 [Patescibacteria group bacterium]
MNTKELLAYTAGLIDGEGYIGLIPHPVTKNSYSPKVKVASTTIELVQFLHDNYGGHLDKLRAYSQPNRKMSAMWTLSNGINVGPFLKKLLPYLRVKNKQANLILEYIEKYTYKKMRGTEKEYVSHERFLIYKQIRLLNHRGLPLAETE